MMKRFLCVFLCLALLLGIAAAEDGPGQPQSPDAVVDGTNTVVYDAASAAGTVVNAEDPSGDFDRGEQIAFSVTPLDVVLVIDASGSMDRANSRNGKHLISYAQDAAIAFCNTLFALNPESRVAVVTYESDVRRVIGLTGLAGRDSIASAIRGIATGNMTNTGGGYAMARSILDADARPGVRQVVLMLSDGLANYGAADPIQYAIDQGRELSRQGLVYTVGLVGGMGSEEKRLTRKVLDNAYATRYYEVDFNKIEDISIQLASAFVSIAMSSSAEDDSTLYRIWVDGSMEVRIEDGSGAYLSTALDDPRDTAPFGCITRLGDEMDQKLIVISDGDYSIRLHGLSTAKGSFSIDRLKGNRAEETSLFKRTVTTHPAMCYVLTLIDGKVTFEDVSYEPLDVAATDPFTGRLTRGSEVAAAGFTAGKAADVFASPGRKAGKMGSVAARSPVNVLASDPGTGSVFISFTDKNGLYSRGWVAKSAVNTDGYVPQMIWLRPETTWTLLRDAQAMRAPGDTGAAGDAVHQGDTVILRHVERDTDGREWAYVELTAGKSKGTYQYIPADALASWQTVAPDGFRIGYAMARQIWQRLIGDNGYTGVMWAAPQADGTGVVLSGRSTATKGPFKAGKGERDAFAIMLAPDGETEQAISHGGSGMDSYHCILPFDGGFFVSGVTRSNDKDFLSIWQLLSHTNKESKKTSRTNALIGRLNRDFSIAWMKSFGVGEVSYGFDMVIQLADGSIAGEGWLTSSQYGTQKSFGQQDFYVVKLTPDGEVLDIGSYGWSGNDVPDSGIATPDGGMILVGSTRRGGTSDGLILIIDAELNLVSSVTYGGSGEDNFDNIRLMPDGTYLLTGFTNSPSGDGVGESMGGMDFWAMNVDSMGRSIWTKRFGGSGDDELCGTTILPNGNCILVGKTYSANGHVLNSTADKKQSDAWAICIDSTGRLLWQFTYGTASNDEFVSACMDEADNCIVLAGVCGNKSDKVGTGLAVKIKPPVE